MSKFWGKKHNRWAVLGLAFGVGPLFFFLVCINPATVRIADFRNRVNVELAGARVIAVAPARASEKEISQLEEIREQTLSRIKKIGSNESLLRFSGILADGLASEAKSFGLQVREVGFQNALIRGGYSPESEQALDKLDRLQAVEWNDLANPLDVPMLKLPSIEIQMTVGSGYAELLDFIESLPEFPAQVSLIDWTTVDDSQGKGFRLRIRGYYFSAIAKPGVS
jgi:hypothetical protein